MTTTIQSSIAVHKVCADLIMKGFFPFVQSNEFCLPVDLIALDPNGPILRIQVKYSTSGVVQQYRRPYNSPIERYNDTDFNYYAIYLPQKDVVVYPNIKFGGIRIATVVPKTDGKFWWYEDFLGFTGSAFERTGREMGADFSHKNQPRLSARKERPSKEGLAELLSKNTISAIARMYTVSDTSIKRWAREYKLVD